MLSWLHPAFVHFAIALLLTAVGLDVVGLWRRNEKLLFAGYWNTLLGALAALVAVATGFVAEQGLGPHGQTSGALLGFHRIFALTATLVAVGLAAARLAMRGYIRPRTRTFYLAAAFAAAALVLVAGLLGGVLVYRYGVGISHEAARAVVDAHAPPPATPLLLPTPDEPPPAPPPARERTRPEKAAQGKQAGKKRPPVVPAAAPAAPAAPAPPAP